MEPDTKSSPPDPDVDVNTNSTFPKPASDAVSRKYRRRSPVGGSSSCDARKFLHREISSY